MASLGELTEDVFTCSLCLEKLKEPRTFPCLHSFCRSCMGQYLAKTHQDWVALCPVCEHQINGMKQGVTLTSIENWVDTFVQNNFMVTISKIKAARASEKACDICRQEHVLVEAAVWCMECLEMLCEDCYRVHRRSKASRDHKMVNVDDLQNESLEKLIRPKARPLVCPSHRDKHITVVCVDCKTAVCETCIVLSHTKCRRLEQLDKVSPNLRIDMLEAKRRVDTCRQGAISSRDGVTEMLQDLTQSKDAAVEEVTQLKDKLIKLLVMKEEKVLNQIETAYSRQRDILTNRKRSCDVSHIALGKTNQFLDNLLTFGTDVDILKNFDTIVKHVNTLERDPVSNFHRTSSTVLKFTPEKKMADILKNTASLGEVKVGKGSHRNNQTVPESKAAVVPLTPKRFSKPLTKGPQKKDVGGTKTPEETPRPTLMTSFTGRCNSDTMKTDLKGVMVLADGCLIVIDVQFRNKRLKKFNQRGKLISHLDPGDCPSSMALLADSDIVVSLPKIKELAVVSSGGTLHVTNRVKTSKSYSSLSSTPDGVIAAVASTTPDTPSIDLISFTGQFLHSLTLDRIRFPLPPKDIAMTSCGLIYILFSGKETLVAMTLQGEVTLSYKATSQHGFKKPISVDCDELDNAYIADLGANKIHVVCGDGSYIGELLGRKDGVREPLALYKTDEGTLAVTQSNGDVKMFKIQAL